MRNALAVLALLAISASCQAAEPKTTTVDLALYSSVMATRTADYLSTEQLLSHGGRELLLPSGLVANKPAFEVFSLGSGVAEIYASRRLRKNHPKLARYMLLTDVVAAGLVAGHNESIRPKKAGGR